MYTSKVGMTPLQVSPLGSADPKNIGLQQALSKGPIQDGLGVFTPEQSKEVKGKIQLDWDLTPDNPIIQGFNSLFKAPLKELYYAEAQTQLFDVDNFVKGQSGVFREKQDGLTDFGTDFDGRSLYAAGDIKDSDDFGLGKNRLYTAGTLLQQMGAFEEDAESENFANLTEMAGDPEFMGQVAGFAMQGDKKGAVNHILAKLNYADLDSLGESEDKKRAYGTAFAAYNYVENLDKMSPGQQSMTMGTLAMMSYKFKDGSDLSSKVLIQDPQGNPKFTVGNAMNLAGAGFDIFSLQKNWDQLDAIQRLTYGAGTSSQLASTGKRLGLMGDPSLGGASVAIPAEKLGQAGFTYVPSAGIGAITGPGEALPGGYEVVGAGQKPGQVVAVPNGLSRTSSTLNGSAEIRSLNKADGLKPAGVGAFKVYSQWQKVPNNPQNGSRGTTMGAGLTQSGITNDPYMLGALVATSVYGNTVNKYPSPTSYREALQFAGNQKDRPVYNVKQLSKDNPAINTMIQGSQAIVNTMAKYGNKEAGGAASYINAAAAGKRLYDILSNPNATDKQKAEAVAGAAQAGVNIAKGLGNQTAGQIAPGINYAMTAYNVSKVLGSNMNNEQKAKALRRTAEDTAAAYYTMGLSSVAQWADQEFLGGKIDELRTKLDEINPGKIIGDKATEALLRGVDSLGGGKSKEQKGRDSSRKLVEDITNGEWALPLSDGTFADIGTDGKGGQHEFRFSERSMGVNRSLNAYDVDYTNDLDFTANLMTSSLMRLVAGGKGTSIDQISGQLANASLGKVGFSQDMTEDNFGYVRDNVKGWFFKKGIQTKEDAYALSNQMFSEGRITEMDQISMQQGINLVFDDNAFDTANILMSGRDKGVEVASDISKSPGPNFDLKPVSEGLNGLENMPNFEGVIDPAFNSQDRDHMEFQFNAGTYGGASNTNAFTRSIIKYKENLLKNTGAKI